LQQPADVRAVEQALKGLWERVRRAGDIIQQLREERRALLSQVEQLRGDVQQLQEEMVRKEQILRKAQSERAVPTAAADAPSFSNGDREAMARKVKELLQKLDAYL
jgi:chromosome segregation ATPase